MIRDQRQGRALERLIYREFGRIWMEAYAPKTGARGGASHPGRVIDEEAGELKTLRQVIREGAEAPDLGGIVAGEI